MKWAKKLPFIDISYRFIVQMSMKFISLYHPRGSGPLIWLISGPRAAFLIVRNVEIKANFFALDNCTVLLSKRSTCSAHRVTDGHTEGRKIH